MDIQFAFPIKSSKADKIPMDVRAIEITSKVLKRKEVVPKPKLKNKITKANELKLLSLKKEFLINDTTRLDFPLRNPNRNSLSQSLSNTEKNFDSI